MTFFVISLGKLSLIFKLKLVLMRLFSWLLAGRDAFVPSRKYQVKPHSSPWFSPACAAAIAHRNHYFHLFQRVNPDENKRLFFHCQK